MSVYPEYYSGDITNTGERVINDFAIKKKTYKIYCDGHLLCEVNYCPFCGTNLRGKEWDI